MTQKTRRSVRGKLLLLILTPILLTLAALIGLTAHWTNTYSDRQLYMKVAADLAVARSTLNLMQERQQERLQQLATLWALQPERLIQEPDHLEALLGQMREQHSFDFLRLLTPQQLTDLPAQHSLANLKAPLLRGEPLHGLSVLSHAEMEEKSPALAAGAAIQVLPTARAHPKEQKLETRGMFVRSLYPLFDPHTGELRWILDGGVMLNHNLEFVDTIRDLVYGPDALPEGGIGTVTLFLDDVRITTNVPVQVNDPQARFERAIGTRISAEVFDRVLGEERLWLDRAFVVSDWFISAYEPIYDLNQQLIGMLYTGFSESPFFEIYLRTLAELAITLGALLFLSAMIVWRSAVRLLNPVAQIHRSVMAVRKGDGDTRIGELACNDEFSDLAHQFDSMLDELDARRETIRQAAEKLEQKVEERTLSLRQKTEELEHSIELLKATRAELFTKEKLAVLGELTAGIAHEINNPAAVILGHMDLLQEELGPGAVAVQEEIDTVIEQVYRIRAIINNLLQYSRPGQVIDQLEAVDVNPVVRDTLALVRHALDKKNIRVALQFASVGSVEGNRQQLQQVLVNLLLNAANAMGQGGQIHLSTHPWQSTEGAEGVEIRVEDEGCGISAELQAHIFEPFFTTRENGNGLGLSISRSLARRYGGDLCVTSVPGEGSRFSIYLRRQAKLNQEDEHTMQQLLSGLGVV